MKCFNFVTLDLIIKTHVTKPVKNSYKINYYLIKMFYVIIQKTGSNILLYANKFLLDVGSGY